MSPVAGRESSTLELPIISAGLKMEAETNGMAVPMRTQFST